MAAPLQRVQRRARALEQRLVKQRLATQRLARLLVAVDQRCELDLARRPGISSPIAIAQRQPDHCAHRVGRRRRAGRGARTPARAASMIRCWLSTSVPSQSNTISRVMPDRSRRAWLPAGSGRARSRARQKPARRVLDERCGHARARRRPGCGRRISRACSISPSGAPADGAAPPYLRSPRIGVPSSAQCARS